LRDGPQHCQRGRVRCRCAVAAAVSQQWVTAAAQQEQGICFQHRQALRQPMGELHSSTVGQWPKQQQKVWRSLPDLMLLCLCTAPQVPTRQESSSPLITVNAALAPQWTTALDIGMSGLQICCRKGPMNACTMSHVGCARLCQVWAVLCCTPCRPSGPVRQPLPWLTHWQSGAGQQLTHITTTCSSRQH
jgi:hypothetical protein